MAKAKARAAPKPQIITIRQPTAKKTTRSRPKKSNKAAALRNGLAALAGGAAGALVGGLLVKAGVKPSTAAVGVTVAGGVGTFTLQGTARHVSTGCAAAGAGQLALVWLAHVRKGLPTGEYLPAEAYLPAELAGASSSPPGTAQLWVANADGTGAVKVGQGAAPNGAQRRNETLDIDMSKVIDVSEAFRQAQAQFDDDDDDDDDVHVHFEPEAA